MDSTITISRADWQRLMTMMENLSEQQAEMSRNQAELVAQLTRANERVRELEEQNSSLLRQPPGELGVAPGAAPVPPEPPLNYRVKSGHRRAQSARPPPQHGAQTASPATTAPPLASAPRSKTWAQIAAAPRPSIKDVTPATQERLRKCLELLDISGPEPVPTAVYFRNIRRNRLGQVRKALRQMFSHPWAVLGLSFIGQSVIEIVCHQGLVDQVVGKLRLLGATHIKNLNVFGDNLKKTPISSSNDRATANLERAHKRFERLVNTCTNKSAKTWYARQLEEADKRLAVIYQRAHDVETSTSEDSGYDSDEIMPESVDSRRGSSSLPDPMTVDDPPIAAPLPQDQAQEAPQGL